MTIKNADGNIYLTERAAADADIAGDGQIWVETATPNILKFTDDAGTDFNIATENKALTTLATEQATTSGTSIDFTGIPSGVKEIKFCFDAVSVSGTSNLIIQLGDSGGIETSGYSGGSVPSIAYNGAGQVDTSTIGFVVCVGQTAAYERSGTVILSLKNAATFSWTSIGMLNRGNIVDESCGVKSLSAELTQVRLTTQNGTDTFDAGSVNIQYSF